ncbi:hypothetical protein E6C60_3671 [Paenibacillus algicola]|uniref:HNH domain-containing protein n=1 Tax=Paenibacillus algicola TaxID=2565926 RepID=A0A4P8XUA6_9BACL|nr:HNH endonuclease [Paenibacillus algicola]QCT04379.1 hypothetical protein E6C60_3671 [Paenibacillus algicola]
MKRFKWFFSLLLVLMLALQLTTVQTNATELVDSTIPSFVDLGENSNDIGQEVVLEFVKEYNEFENPNEVTDKYFYFTFEDDGSSKTSEITKYEANMISSLSAVPSSAGGVVVSVRLDPAGVNKATFTSKIISIAGSKPNKLDFKIQLGKSMTRSNSTTIVSSVTKRLQGILGIKVGAEVTHTFDVTQTGFYTGVLDLTASNLIGSTLGTDRANSPTLLLNNKAKLYPVYTDPASARVMREPDRADWARTPSIDWTYNDTKKYRKWYNETYPNVYDWTKNHVHHMRPRNLGGTNDYSNLIPLPSTFHTGTVSPWFVNY